MKQVETKGRRVCKRKKNLQNHSHRHRWGNSSAPGGEGQVELLLAFPLKGLCWPRSWTCPLGVLSISLALKRLLNSGQVIRR